MEEDLERNQEALVLFLQGLALAVVSLDDPTSAVRSSASVLQVLDAMLDDIPSMTEREGVAELYQSVQVIRQNFDVALAQARNVARG